MKTKNINGINIPLCEECGIDMPHYQNALYGFVSQTKEIPKLAQVGGYNGIEAVEVSVCWDCYIKSYKERFPDQKLPPKPIILDEQPS